MTIYEIEPAIAMRLDELLDLAQSRGLTDLEQAELSSLMAQEDRACAAAQIGRNLPRMEG